MNKENQKKDHIAERLTQAYGAPMIRDNNGRYVYENNTDNKKFPIDKIKKHHNAFISLKKSGFDSCRGGYYVYQNDEGVFIEKGNEEKISLDNRDKKHYKTLLYIPTKEELKISCKDLFIKIFENSYPSKIIVSEGDTYSNEYFPILINLNILDTTSMSRDAITDSQYEESYLSLVYLYCDLKYNYRISRIKITKFYIIFFSIIAIILYVFK